MSAGDLAYVVAALLAVALIPSVPALGSISYAGPHSRAELVRQLWIGWGVWAFLVAWLFIGWFAIDAGTGWFRAYFAFTLLLMCAFFPLLVVGIRSGNRRVAAAQAMDRSLPA